MTESMTAALPEFLANARWFGGKGRSFDVTAVRTLGTLPGEPDVAVHLVEVTYAGGDSELYQVPLVYYAEPQSRLDHAFVGWWEDDTRGWVHAYDALHDRDAMGLWLQAFSTSQEVPGLAFFRLEGHELDATAHSTLFSGEQSNSSVAFGEDALMKVFRKVTPGVNPDIEIHQVLTEAGSEHVAALYGWLEAHTDGEPVQLAMLSQFLRTAADGWDLALASVRGLFGDPELHAGESGGDFAGEATLLGEALAEVHTQLADAFGTHRLDAGATRQLARDMQARLDAALDVVPSLAVHAPALRDTFDKVAGLDSLIVQRIHGDLHLGQTLRTSKGWKLVDFEGEPAKPLTERTLPDSPWRDVAGMLRSFDYAPRAFLRTLGTEPEAQDEPESQLEQRASEWANRNRNHFLVAYAGGELPEDAKVLLEAYVADKAVYETVYETRNRPGWVSIPLGAVGRIAAA